MLNPIEIKSIVNSGEGFNAEFKVNLPTNLKSITEEVCAFANASGGVVLIGVDDKNIPNVKGGMDAYFEFVKKQCTELIQKYHTKNFWFDGFWHPEWYDSPRYRKELSAYLKSLDANIIMSRLQMPFKPAGGMWDDGWDLDKNV